MTISVRQIVREAIARHCRVAISEVEDDFVITQGENKIMTDIVMETKRVVKITIGMTAGELATRVENESIRGWKDNV